MSVKNWRRRRKKAKKKKERKKETEEEDPEFYIVPWTKYSGLELYLAAAGKQSKTTMTASVLKQDPISFKNITTKQLS